MHTKIKEALKKGKPTYDMLGIKLEVGAYIAIASTCMHNGMQIYRLTEVTQQDYIQAIEIAWHPNLRNRVGGRKVRLIHVRHQSVVLKDYKEPVFE